MDQVRTLFHLFFQGFFDAELIHPEGESRLTVGHILALLASPGIFLTMPLMETYFWLAYKPPWAYDLQVWRDKLFFLTLGGVVTGIVTIYQWDALFLNKRDYIVLGQMPVRWSRILTAKVAALLAFAGLFIVDVNMFAWIGLPYVAIPVDRPLAEAAVFFTTHTLSTIGMGLFVFLFLLALQGTLMNLLPAGWFRTITPAMQFLFIVALLCALLLFPTASRMLGPHGKLLHPLAEWHPGVWFATWSESASGRAQPAAALLGARCWIALGLTAFWAAAMYLLSYYRHAKRSLELAADPPTAPGLLRRASRYALSRTLLRHPLEQSIFHFAVRTIARSRPHRLVFSTYFGVGLAVMLNSMVSDLARKGYEAWMTPSPAVLSLPLTAIFCLVLGQRSAFSTPALLKANWIFQISEPAEKLSIQAVRKLLLVTAAAPPILVFSSLGFVLWGWRTGLYHTVFLTAMAWLLIELALLRFRKIPFTCSRIPGKVNLPYYGMLFLTGFLIYSFSGSQVEAAILKHPAGLIPYGIVWSIAMYWLLFQREDETEVKPGLVFEDQLDPVAQPLKLADT